MMTLWLESNDIKIIITAYSIMGNSVDVEMIGVCQNNRKRTIVMDSSLSGLSGHLIIKQYCVEWSLASALRWHRWDVCA